MLSDAPSDASSTLLWFMLSATSHASSTGLMLALENNIPCFAKRVHFSAVVSSGRALIPNWQAQLPQQLRPE
jgi:hypothetical protein